MSHVQIYVGKYIHIAYYWDFYSLDITATVTPTVSLSGLRDINISPLVHNHFLLSHSVFSILSFLLFPFLILCFLSQGVNLLWWGSRGQRLPNNFGVQGCAMCTYVHHLDWVCVCVCGYKCVFSEFVWWTSIGQKSALQWLSVVLGSEDKPFMCSQVYAECLKDQSTEINGLLLVVSNHADSFSLSALGNLYPNSIRVNGIRFV